MTSIVVDPLKVDLHIHSFASRHKDGGLVSSGTKENLPVLWGKLKDNDVDVFSITDHDCFDYSLYLENKKKETDCTFEKVFPGIEFSVLYTDKQKNDKHPIHVIAIFDDKDEEKVKHISELLPPETVNYDDGDSFSEERFQSLLRQIDLNVVLIAHQKNSLSSKTPRKDDANSVGPGRFNEFINAGYFEAYEFKSAQAGLFNKLFKTEHDPDDNLRFITGSDCHEWSSYPKTRAGDLDDMVFTYLKCLPSFRGLSMALTDSSRVRRDPNFFSDSSHFFQKIEINVNGRVLQVPLSKGINVIIGDNSTGKSMLLHAMTEYRAFLDSPNLRSEVKTGYQEYLKKFNIIVSKIIPAEDVYKFDSQGEIRKRFEAGDAFKQPFIVSQYPEPTDATPYRSFVDNQFQNLYQEINKRLDYTKLLSQLGEATLVPEPNSSKNLAVTLIPISDIEKTSTTVKIQNSFNSLKAELQKLQFLISDENDIHTLSTIEQTLTLLAGKYVNQLDLINLRNSIRNSINHGIGAFKHTQQAVANDEDTKWDSFQTAKSEMASNMSKIFGIVPPENKFSFSFDDVPVSVNKHPFGTIAFVNRFKCNVPAISASYCQKILESALIDGSSIDLSTITSDSLTGMIKEKKEYPGCFGVDLLQRKISSILDDEFEPEKAIVKNDGKDDAEYSSGFNATKYFDLIADDINDQGIYIVDQPEDDVSQLSIKTNIIPDLRKMRTNRQIILITHNPQFVVNLDADNVMYFFGNGDGFDIKSGALEYQDKDRNCDILKLISDNLEGGIESLKKRWKRYEKDPDLAQD